MTHCYHSRLRALSATAFLLFSVPALTAFNPGPGGTTIADTDTGLTWDRCSLGQDWNPVISRCDGNADAMNWADALNAAVTANASSYLGHKDWRLPNRTELESLVDLSTWNPAIDTTAFPDTPSSLYWTSTTYAPIPDSAWYIFFDEGTSPSVAYPKTFTGLVRLVRSGHSFDALGAHAPGGMTPTQIPTLSEWAMVVTMLGLFGVGAWEMRRRRSRA